MSSSVSAIPFFSGGGRPQGSHILSRNSYRVLPTLLFSARAMYAMREWCPMYDA